MIRDEHQRQGSTGERPAVSAAGHAPAALDGSRLADRFCAWKGRSERRSIFTVFPLRPGADVAALPLEGGGVALGVRPDAAGRRRILWAAVVGAGRAPDALAAAVAALASAGGEVHLHLLAVNDAAREAIVAELDCPRLAMGRSAPGLRSAAVPVGASAEPVGWPRRRSA